MEQMMPLCLKNVGLRFWWKLISLCFQHIRSNEILIQRKKQSFFTTVSRDTKKTLSSDGLTQKIEPIIMKKNEFEHHQKY